MGRKDVSGTRRLDLELFTTPSYLTRNQTYSRPEAAGTGAFFPIGKKSVMVMGGTDSCRLDVVGGAACLEKLVMIGFP